MRSLVSEFICRISAMTTRVSASGSYASATDHRLSPGRISTLASAPPGPADVPECPVAWAAPAAAMDAAPIATTAAAVRDIAAVRGIRPFTPRRTAARALPAGPATISFTSASHLKRPFDHTPVRSYDSSIERDHAMFVPRGSDILATRRTDVW